MTHVYLHTSTHAARQQFYKKAKITTTTISTAGRVNTHGRWWIICGGGAILKPAQELFGKTKQNNKQQPLVPLV